MRFSASSPTTLRSCLLEHVCEGPLLLPDDEPSQRRPRQKLQVWCGHGRIGATRSSIAVAADRLRRCPRSTFVQHAALRRWLCSARRTQPLLAPRRRPHAPLLLVLPEHERGET